MKDFIVKIIYKKRLQTLWLVSLIILIMSCVQVDKTIPEGMGKLEIKLLDKDSGKPIPGKWMFFDGEEPVDLGLSSTKNLAVRNHTIYTLTGLDTIIIPTGKYNVWAGRGMEFDNAKESLILQNQNFSSITLKIKRSVDTYGYVSGDMHLHTVTHSGHGDSNMEERIISCIGEGVEWAVATDHNHVVDYDTVITSLDATKYIFGSVGNEVSTQFGHFNSFPLKKGSEPVVIDSVDANKLFKQIRLENKMAVIQVNHPRWNGIDYFTLMDMDEYLADTDNKNWGWDFDAIEILNENSGWGWEATAKNPYSVRQDWYNMLNSGRRITGVGNSDSHAVEKLLPGVPRNFIQSSTDDPKLIDEKEMSDHINRGKVSVSQGLFVQMWVNGIQPRNDTTLVGGLVDIRVKVQGPNWVDCRQVQIIANGLIVKNIKISKTGAPVRFDKTFTMDFSQDTWLMAIASGNESMAPMIHNAPDPITPLGFTNPLWIDANEDGHFESLKSRAMYLVNKNIKDIQSLILLLKKEPQMIPFAVASLIENSPKSGIALIRELLPDMDRDLTLFMIRQLGKLNLVESINLLEEIETQIFDPLIRSAILLTMENSADKDLTPSQIKKMVSYFQFPEDGDSKIESYILDFIHEGDQNLKKKFSGERVEDLGLKEGFLNIEEYSWRKETNILSGYYEFSNLDRQYIMVEFWSQNSGDMPFIIESDTPYYGWVNGSLKIHRKIGTENRFGSGKVLLPIRTGKNQIILVLHHNPSHFFLVPLDSNKWINPLLKDKVKEQHLGLNNVPELLNPNAEKYRGGENALTDGYRGSTQFADGFWMGFEEKDMVLILNFTKPTLISQITASFLQDYKSWIWLPLEMEILIMGEGNTFESVGKWNHSISDNKEPAFINESIVNIDPVLVRKVKIVAKNMGTCPSWHQGADGKAWIFCDEIKFK